MDINELVHSEDVGPYERPSSSHTVSSAGVRTPHNPNGRSPVIAEQRNAPDRNDEMGHEWTSIDSKSSPTSAVDLSSPGTTFSSVGVSPSSPASDYPVYGDIRGVARSPESPTSWPGPCNGHSYDEICLSPARSEANSRTSFSSDRLPGFGEVFHGSQRMGHARQLFIDTSVPGHAPQLIASPSQLVSPSQTGSQNSSPGHSRRPSASRRASTSRVQPTSRPPAAARSQANRQRGSRSQRAQPLRRSSRADPADVEASDGEEASNLIPCEADETCTAVIPRRRVISHFFGRNKTQTLQIPNHFWTFYCRRHYQRTRYKLSDAEFAERQMQLVTYTLKHLQDWGMVKDFDIRFRRCVLQDLEDVEKRNNEIAAARANNMPAPKQIPPVNDLWLRPYLGNGKSFDEVYRIVDLVARRALQDGLPAVRFELVPNYIDEYAIGDQPQRHKTA